MSFYFCIQKMCVFHHNTRVAPSPPSFAERLGGSLLLFLLLLTTCSDDYLDITHNQPEIRSPQALYITPTSGYMEYEITVQDAGDNDYSIGRLPKWLTFRYYKGNFQNDVATLKFTVQNVITTSEPGTYENELVLVIRNTGIYIIPVLMVNK